MGNCKVLIRYAVISDLSFIQNITREAFEMYTQCAAIPGTTPALEETCTDIMMDLKTKHCFVAEIDGCVVGCVRIEVKEDNCAYLSRFAVAIEYQSMGIGSKLMDFVDEVMKQMEVEKIYLHTASKILSLVRFYYGRGYYIDSTTKDRGYIRALLCKEYKESSYKENPVYGTFAV